MLRRRFNGAGDLAAMQRLVAQRTWSMGPCTNLHPGDVAHRIYSGLRGREIRELVPVWETDGEIVAFGMVWQDDGAFDVVPRVDLDGHLVARIIEELAEVAGGGGPVETDVIGDDPRTTVLLTDLGFARDSAGYVFAQAPLERLPPVESHGFTIRSVTFSDVEDLAAVHSGAFGSGWSGANYESRMREPGYDPHDEIVAVDSTGTFMGFAITWYDNLNAVGHFEPVGVHRDFHRLGVGSALLSTGKERMRQAGMDTATVWHAANETLAAAFYGTNGFEPVNPVVRWIRR